MLIFSKKAKRQNKIDNTFNADVTHEFFIKEIENKKNLYIEICW
jgi:hypothetical protein